MSVREKPDFRAPAGPRNAKAGINALSVANATAEHTTIALGDFIERRENGPDLAGIVPFRRLVTSLQGIPGLFQFRKESLYST
jgi:hypothetical protein